jgi:hypothetical protein
LQEDAMQIVAGGIILLVIVVFIAMRPLKKIALSAQKLAVTKDQPTPLVAVLVYKGWFKFSFTVVPGTITFFTGASVFTVAPTPITVTLAAPDAIADVTEVIKGTGTITVNGTSAEGKHDPERVSVTCV